MKTPKEFDYDLFRNDEGLFFVRVKQTGQVSEVSVDIFRLLRNEAMRMYRKQKGIPVYGNKNGKSVVLEYVTLLVLQTDENSTMDGRWLIDNTDVAETVIVETMLSGFKEILTEKQLDVLENCLLPEIPLREFARKRGVHKSSVDDLAKAIRKKFIKYYF